MMRNIVEAYNTDGVRGLEALGLTDSQIIDDLGRYCIGRPDITKTLYGAGWSLDRFLEAEKKLGYDAKALQELEIKYRQLEDQFQFFGIKGLEDLGLSDVDILKKIPACYCGGMEDTIRRLRDAGWTLKRIYAAQQQGGYQWPYEETKRYYRKAGEISLPSQLNELGGLVDDFKELQIWLENVGIDITPTPKELKKIKSATNIVYRQIHITLGKQYLNLAETAKGQGRSDLAKELTRDARVMFTSNSPTQTLVERLLLLEASLGT